MENMFYLSCLIQQGDVMATPTQTYRIQDRDFSLPCEVRHATSGAATFLVSASAASKLLQGPDFEIVEFLPGRAICSLAIIDYKDNDLGDYDEVSIAFFVRPRGERPLLPYLGNWIDMVRGELGVHIIHLPVNQSFTCEAGRRIWGYPKTVQEIDFHYEDDRATCRLVYDGQHALTLSVPRGGDREMKGGSMKTYSYIEGVPHVTRASQDVTGMGMKMGGAELELGTGLIADQLRSLGLPKKALMTVWLDHMRGTFGAAEKL
jgi:hypothetical protein